jgi:hypothetical protein
LYILAIQAVVKGIMAQRNLEHHIFKTQDNMNMDLNNINYEELGRIRNNDPGVDDV